MRNILVMGGNGFLGSALVRTLQQQGLGRVRSFDLKPNPDPSVESLVGDLRDPQQVEHACQGIDTVFQTASLIDWGPRNRARLYAVNVQGNRHVIAACHKLGVERLVYTSSIDVVFDGSPIRGGSEDLPYATRHLDDYGATKALAEQDVLRANDPSGLQTCALRSAGIYGPGDRVRFPIILETARKGNMVSMGDSSTRFDHVYITHLVDAHLKAAQALRPGSAVSGQAYFIGDENPQNFYDFFMPYLQALGYSTPTRRIPLPLAYGAALALESLARLGIGPQPPLLTRYVVLSTCRDFYFSCAKARRDFGYAPFVSPQQCFTETLEWLRQTG